MATRNIAIDENLHARVKVVAAQLRRPMTQVVEVALREYMDAPITEPRRLTNKINAALKKMDRK